MRITWFLVMDLEMVFHLRVVLIFKFILLSIEILCDIILLSASTHDQEVFSFYPDEDTYCNGFEEVLSRYRELVPQLRLAGYILFYSPSKPSFSFLAGCCLILVDLYHFCSSDRTHIICPYHWNGHDHSWAKWWSVSCISDNSWWAGILIYLISYLYTPKAFCLSSKRLYIAI